MNEALQPSAIGNDGAWEQQYAYSKVKYICACRQNRHIKLLYFDQAPPERCPDGMRMLRDSKYEVERPQERTAAAINTRALTNW